MSLTKIQAVINGLRARGITVHESPGWQNRCNGQTADYRGGIVHHTGSAYGSAYNALIVGRPDLAGPLCNFAGNDDGSMTVISAGPANHAGASGGYSMGTLPVSQGFNKYVMGLEIVYPGTSPMRPAQYHAATVWARVVADVCGGGNIQCVRAHAETSVTGKWDPGDRAGHTIDMAAFRAASINPTQEAGVSAEDVASYMRSTVRKGPDGVDRNLEDTLFQTSSWVGETLNSVKPLSDDEANIVAAVRAQTTDQVDVSELSARLTTSLGPAIAAELGRRLVEGSPA